MKGTKEKKETKRMMSSGDGFVIGSSDILIVRSSVSREQASIPMMHLSAASDVIMELLLPGEAAASHQSR